jgi:hypothetical protein
MDSMFLRNKVVLPVYMTKAYRTEKNIIGTWKNILSV